MIPKSVGLISVLVYCLALATHANAQQEQQELAAAHALVQTNPDEAITKLKALAARHPQLRGINHELGLAYYQKSDFLNAMTYLEKAVRQDPEDRDATQLLGLAYYFNGRPADAIPPLEKVRSWYPSVSMDAGYILGLCYVLTEHYQQALNTLANLYSVAPDSAGGHLILAQMLLRQGFDPVAEEEAKKALALSSRLPFAHYLLGQLHLLKQEAPEAIAEFEKELAINPGNAATYTRLGEAYSRLRQYEDAEKVLRRSIWLDSTAVEPYVTMGKVLLKKGQPALAERPLQRAIALDPNSYSAHHFLGEAYQQTGRPGLAEREMKLGAQIQQLQTQNAPR